MSVIKCKEQISPQNYCGEYFKVCPIFTGEKDELRSLLDKNGHSELRDFALDEVELVVASSTPVVLVDTTYIDDDCNIVPELRWFQIPCSEGKNKSKEHKSLNDFIAALFKLLKKAKVSENDILKEIF